MNNKDISSLLKQIVTVSSLQEKYSCVLEFMGTHDLFKDSDFLELKSCIKTLLEEQSSKFSSLGKRSVQSKKAKFSKDHKPKTIKQSIDSFQDFPKPIYEKHINGECVGCGMLIDDSPGFIWKRNGCYFKWHDNSPCYAAVGISKFSDEEKKKFETAKTAKLEWEKRKIKIG